MVASSYGTLVGGGSLLTIPALILLGIPPQTAIATNRFGVIGTSTAGWYKFGKKKLINYKIGIFLAVFFASGALIGANLMLRTDEIFLKKMVAIVTLVILLFVMFKDKIGIQERKHSVKNYEWILGAILFLGFGVYQGFYGAGSGTLISYVLVIFFGQTFIQSAATRKISGFVGSLSATIVFMLHKQVIYPIAITMFIAMLTGSYIGAHYSTKIGNVWTKRLFFAIVIIMALKLLI